MTRSAWLVAIDLQHVFADPDSPWATPCYARAAAGVQRLLPAFVGRTIFTRFIAPAEPQGVWTRYYRDWPFALRPADDPVWALTPEFVADRPSIDASTFGKWGAPLDAAVGGAREIVLAGVSTDCCVLSTALAAADAGVHVQLVADACAGVSDVDHQRAIDAMALYGPLIEVTDIDTVLAAAA